MTDEDTPRQGSGQRAASPSGQQTGQRGEEAFGGSGTPMDHGDDVYAALERIEHSLTALDDRLAGVEDRLSAVEAGGYSGYAGDYAESGDLPPPPPPPEDRYASAQQAPPVASRRGAGTTGRGDNDDGYGDEPPSRRRGPLVAWIIIVLLIAGGAYYIFSDPSRLDRLTGLFNEQTPVDGAADLGDGDVAASQSAEPDSTGTEGTDVAAADLGSLGTPSTAEGGNDTGPTATDGEDPAQRDAADAGASGVSADDPATPASSQATPERAGTETSVGLTEPGGVQAGEVETQVLEDVDNAPLPDDASPELQTLARAAQAGIADAQHDLGTLYALGESGLEQSYERAVFWYSQAANQGVVNAIYNLGVLTGRGLGTEPNADAAFDLFLRAAEAGHPEAQNAVGLAYAEGRGTDQDLSRASQWLQAASANGYARGAFHMGRLFERGIDGAPDLSAAAGWYQIAADQGVSEAQEALERLVGSGEVAVGDPQEISVPVPETTPQPTPLSADDTAELDEDAIALIQGGLNQLGFDAGPADGVMGSRTRAAIENFQRSISLEVTGEPSLELLEMIRSVSGQGG